MRVHFIAVGGAAMHNLALALARIGHQVSGSDDEIFEPSRSRLREAGLLPPSTGWDRGRITTDLDAVIIGMHAHRDNPELERALELKIPIYSFPEYLYLQTKEKKRVVVGGSHGKTTITSMIMHVLKKSGYRFDYLVGAQLEGFETMVGLRNDSEIAVFEGDEYLASPLDPRPKFHIYRAHIALLSGIAWDHINVFPTFENYLEQFEAYLESIEPGGTLIYCCEDRQAARIAETARGDLRIIGYETHPHQIRDHRYLLDTPAGPVPLQIFGRHNLLNLSAARRACAELGVGDASFYRAIESFRGAARRLQLLERRGNSFAYLDFAHAPSKVKGSTGAVRELHPHHRLVACLELHTFSSLSRSFLSEYRGTLDGVDRAFVYYDPETVEKKRLEPVSPEEVHRAFDHPRLQVVTEREALLRELRNLPWKDAALLAMSSGSFSGIDFGALSRELFSGPSDGAASR